MKPIHNSLTGQHSQQASIVNYPSKMDYHMSTYLFHLLQIHLTISLTLSIVTPVIEIQAMEFAQLLYNS